MVHTYCSYGLVAEEVATVYPDLVARDGNGEPFTVRYQFLAPMLLNEYQKQQQTIDELLQRVSHLTRLIERLAIGTTNDGDP